MASLEVVVSNLISQINDLLKKPNIDEQLSNVLDKFLNNLKESESYLQNGILTINFAEASLLLENSCVLYGKKVDILWNDVHDNLQRWHSYNKSRNVSDETDLHEKTSRFRRRKTIPQQNNSKDFAFNQNSLLQEAENVPNLPQIVGSACKTLDNLWSEATQSSLKLKRLRAKVAPLVSTHIKKTPIYLENNDKKLCYYNDLCLNLFDSGYMLHDDKTTQLYNLRHLIDDILQTYLVQNEITYTKLAECNMWPDFKKFLQLNITKRLRILVKKQRERMNGGWDRKQPLIAQRPPIDLSMLHVFGEFHLRVDATDADSGGEEIAQVVEADGDLDVTMSPVSSAKGYVSRRTSEMHSEADSAFHDGSFEDDDERNVRSKQEDSYIMQMQSSTATDSRKNTISSDDTGYFEDSLREKTPGNDADCINENDSMVNGISAERWMDNNQEVQVTQEFGGLSVSDYEDEQEREEWNGDESDDRIVEEKNLDELQQKTIRKRKRDDSETDDGSDHLPKRRESTRIRATRQRTVTVPLIVQEDFFVRNYNCEENEGGLIDTCTCSSKQYDEKYSAWILLDHCYSKSISSEIETPLPPVEDDLHLINNNTEDEEQDVCRTPSPISLPLPERVELNEQTTNKSEILSKTSNDIEQFARQKAALDDWKSFIQPKIDAASEKPDFDIHEYGTHIMDAIPLGESRNFNHVIKGKPPSEVSRLFLATLQLANTNNVLLENVPVGQLANDVMCVKLLSRERYHEQLEEYVAPSEETYRDRFKQACKSRSSTSTHSSNPNKRIKIC